MRTIVKKSPIRKGKVTPVEVTQYSKDDEGVEEIATDFTSAQLVKMVNARLVTKATNATAKGMPKADKVRLAMQFMVKNEPATMDRYAMQFQGKDWTDMMAEYYDTHLAESDTESDTDEDVDETGE